MSGMKEEIRGQAREMLRENTTQEKLDNILSGQRHHRFKAERDVKSEVVHIWFNRLRELYNTSWEKVKKQLS